MLFLYDIFTSYFFFFIIAFIILLAIYWNLSVAMLLLILCSVTAYIMLHYDLFKSRVENNQRCREDLADKMKIIEVEVKVQKKIYLDLRKIISKFMFLLACCFYISIYLSRFISLLYT